MLSELRIGWTNGTPLTALLLALACSGSSVRNGKGGSGGEAGASDNTGATGAGATTATGSGASGGSAAIGSGASAATGSGSAGTENAGNGAGGTPPDNGCGRGSCLAGSSAMPIPAPGPVLCGGVECEAPMACCLATQVCFDPEVDAEACAPPPQDDDIHGRPTCSSNADCDTGYFCQIESGLCQGTGHCHPMDNCGACLGDSGHCRVCGCDGNTYDNFQTACLTGTNVVSVSGGGCGDTVTFGGGGSSSGERSRQLCATDSNCDEGENCCTITGFCYPSDDPEQCRLPPEGTSLPCTSDAQCSDYEYCAGEGCAGPGGCVQMGSQEECGVTLEPVCGCDGVSYTSAACAASRGVRVASEGACAE